MYSRSTLFLAAAIFTGSVATAGAADVYQDDIRGSIKDDAIETILVPAAVEIPETLSWYLRGDLNYGTGADVETTATIPGLVGPLGVSNPDGNISGGIGFGRYLSRNTRIDFTFDYSDDEHVFRFNGQREIDLTRNVDYLDGVGATQNAPVDFRITVQDQDVKSLASHTAMVNFYYDFARLHGLRPYVGAGLGVAIHEIERTNRSSYLSCRQTSIPADHQDVGTFDPNNNTCSDLPAAERTAIAADHTRSGEEKKIGLGLAASLQVGMSYEMSHGLHLDTSYRLKYSGGSLATAKGLANIETGDRTDQEVRIGLRYDIW